jgi:hypothetical protein
MEHAGVDRCLSPAELSGILSRSTGPRLFLVPAEVLAPDDFPGIVSEDSGEVRIVVGERHFLRSADEEIVRFAGSLNHPCRLAFHLSLDEPLMRLFVGDWVRNMLSGLGMTESNPISNPMITRRIKAAQAGLAKQVTDERKAASAQEWLRLNLPENAETSSGD